MSISKFKQEKLAELFDILHEYDGIHHATVSIEQWFDSLFVECRSEYILPKEVVVFSDDYDGILHITKKRLLQAMVDSIPESAGTFLDLTDTDEEGNLTFRASILVAARKTEKLVQEDSENNLTKETEDGSDQDASSGVRQVPPENN